jgi:D-alanyl-D-alanine carboxypeptidase
MTHRQPARTTSRRVPIRMRRIRVAGLLLVIAAIAAALQLLTSSPSTASSPWARVSPFDVLRGAHDGARSEADGAVPDGTTVFDDDVPAVSRLDPDLLAALHRAATDAANDGVALLVDGGWRSPAYQQRLLHEAISKYGSEEQAARWVATPTTSAHVSGDAVDLGPSAATAWLSGRGVEYGLCRIYANEPWHYELRPDAIGRGCPPMYADPTHDPRMRR